MRAIGIVGWAVVAVAAGIAAGEGAYRSKFCRSLIGRCFGRGDVIAFVQGRGVYDADVRRETGADRYCAGASAEASAADAILKRLIANERLRQLSRNDEISDFELERELDLLRYQFGDDNSWHKRLGGAALMSQQVLGWVRTHLSARTWIEESLRSGTRPDEQTLRSYYAQHSAAFMEPPRFRVSHIFLAAPLGIRADTVEAKKQLISSLADRLRSGEDFGALVWEASEDEATKMREGDLGYVSESRIPPDIFTFVSQLKVGAQPAVFSSALGFHLFRLTEIKPSREISFEEARPEIAASFQNTQRRQAIANLRLRLAGSSPLRTRWFWN